MANGDREQELHNEWADLERRTADSRISITELSALMKRKIEVLDEMQRLGVNTVPDAPAIIANGKPV